jgi:hypothetical protein
MVCNQRPGMIDGLLELGAARVARPVLRGGGGSDATSLPNQVGLLTWARNVPSIGGHEPQAYFVLLKMTSISPTRRSGAGLMSSLSGRAK